ncbi:unnamed protein product [Adineta steineri]|uniref:Methyltransferase-like protein n=1 Tax=Adineta steineri TaxID=433720 RepID=A0A819S9A5_9BILA|nr:unnamed protein product [Adineta steineri]CAF4055803.1 unnamed protein product [Adineta steineri]
METTNWILAPLRVTIRDLRGKEKSVNLDTNALEVLKYQGSVHGEFEEDSEAQKTYYEEISDILKKRLGASRVLIYHYFFRSRGTPSIEEQHDDRHNNPIFYPHVDVAAAKIPSLVEKLLGKEEAERAMQHRFQVINVWRPLGSNPITHKPLAICDYRSIDVDKDVHSFDILGIGYTGAAYTISPNVKNTHTWYYLSQMRSDEMFVFKTFDNKPDVAQFAFHTAFTNGNEFTPNVEQKSLDIRCLVFYDE